MKIKFMFNSPNDASLLYTYTEEPGESPFSDEDTVRVKIRRSKEYSEVILDDVKACISGFAEYKYLGSRERISREVYQLIINNTPYEVAFVFDKREENNIQLHIEIESPTIDDPDFETRYNKTLELLKLALKDRVSKDWQGCTWLIDDQSEMLGADLYHRFFRIENQFRAYANKVLIQHLGQNWLERPGLEPYKDSVCSMENSFKRIVPQFANINTSLLSMTLETLSKVILKSVIYKESTTLTSAELTRLYQYLEKRNEQAAKELVEKKRETKINLWDDIFSQYFADPEQFKRQLTQFIKARNHIAHNKLLTFFAFKKMHDELSDFESTLSKALEQFEQKNASEELLDTWQYEQEQDEYDEQYWRDRIFGETGVEIRDEDEIYELLCQTVTELYDTLSDRYHYDPCFDVSDMETPVKDGTTKVCVITSNASDEKLNVFVSIVVDDDMDTSSYLTIEAKHGEDVIAKVECTYHNGEGHEGEEGLCVADSDSEYDDIEVHDFLEDLIDYIEEDLNPYVKQVSAMEYEYGRHGGISPVAEFACQECGKDGVSITEDLLQIGKCCYCGYENEHYVCELCGMVYDDMGGDEHLCNGCMPHKD